MTALAVSHPWYTAYWPQWLFQNFAPDVALTAAAAIAAFLGRHKIGRNLAAWWAKHHHEHAVAQHLEALTRYAAGEDGRTHGTGEGM